MKAIKHEQLAVPPRAYGMGVTADQVAAETNVEESIGKIKPGRQSTKECIGVRKPFSTLC